MLNWPLNTVVDMSRDNCLQSWIDQWRFGLAKILMLKRRSTSMTNFTDKSVDSSKAQTLRHQTGSGSWRWWRHRQQVLWKISKLQFHVFMRSDKSQAAAAANYPATQVCPARLPQRAGLLGLLVWWHRRFYCLACELRRSIHLIWQNNRVEKWMPPHRQSVIAQWH